MQEQQPIYDMQEIAKRQKAILWMILLGLVASFIPPATLVTGSIQIYFVSKLASATRTRSWAYIIGAFLPLINFLVLAALNSTATGILKANGIRVGLMGANSADLERARQLQKKRATQRSVRTPAVMADSGRG
jgi:purine-cytosine permease-like protein